MLHTEPYTRLHTEQYIMVAIHTGPYTRLHTEQYTMLHTEPYIRLCIVEQYTMLHTGPYTRLYTEQYTRLHTERYTRLRTAQCITYRLCSGVAVCTTVLRLASTNRRKSSAADVQI